MAKCKCGKTWQWDWDFDTFRSSDTDDKSGHWCLERPLDPDQYKLKQEDFPNAFWFDEEDGHCGVFYSCQCGVMLAYDTKRVCEVSGGAEYGIQNVPEEWKGITWDEEEHSYGE